LKDFGDDIRRCRFHITSISDVTPDGPEPEVASVPPAFRGRGTRKPDPNAEIAPIVTPKPDKPAFRPAARRSSPITRLVSLLRRTPPRERGAVDPGRDLGVLRLNRRVDIPAAPATGVEGARPAAARRVPPEDPGQADDARPAQAEEPAGPNEGNGTTTEGRAMPQEGRDRSQEAALLGETVEGDTGPIMKRAGGVPDTGGGGDKSKPPKFHKRLGPQDFEFSLKQGLAAIRRNFLFVMVLTLATNLLILAIPIYLFQISDRVLTSRSVDTLIMLTDVIVGAIVLQVVFDAIRRFMLMRTAAELAARLGSPILTMAARASLHSNGREYQTLGDLQQLRGFLVSGTLLAFLDVPFTPIMIAAVFLVHPHLGFIVVTTAIALFLLALLNQKLTKKPFAQANMAQSRANLHLDSMSRNSQIINALAMIPEAVTIWGRDTANSLISQIQAQDRNIVMAAVSRLVRLLTQIAMLGWGAYLAIDGEITGGMVIAASIIAGRALGPIEGAIEGWNAFLLSQASYDRIVKLLRSKHAQYERLNLPKPEGRVDVERLLYVPAGTKHVVLNGVSFALNPGETLAVIGNSGAGKTTLGKMLVGSIMPTSGNVRLDLMDIRNWDPRQFGENIGYLPQDVQLFPGSIKANIGRMRDDATDADIYHAAELADVHEMIASLPQGYETIVAADGSPLSGGQKQRIALARAFFGKPRFVVLDEPNSNLDTNGDKALAEAIRRAKRDRITVIIITQKPSILSIVDKIMLLADGNIQLFGDRIPVLEKLAGRKPAAGKAVPNTGQQAGKAVPNNSQQQPQRGGNGQA